MTSSIQTPERLAHDSLEFAAFEKIRRISSGHADGSTFFHDGIEYGLRIDVPCRLELTHAVIECLSGPMAGQQQAMASLYWKSQDRHDVNGLALVIQALAKGISVSEISRSHNPTWRVLPRLPVPSCYVKSEISADDDKPDGELVH